MQDLGKLLLRWTVGGLMAFHGYAKISKGFEEGVAFAKPMLKGEGLPEWLAYGLYAGELLAPALLIVGLFPRLAGLGIAATMGMALYLAHQGDFGEVTNHGAWAVETPVFFLMGGLCIALIGGGKYSIQLGGGSEPTLES